LWPLSRVAKAWSRSTISQKTVGVKHPESILYTVYIFIYYVGYILKNMQNAKFVVKNIEIYKFVPFVDKYYIIVNLEIPSIVD